MPIPSEPNRLPQVHGSCQRGGGYRELASSSGQLGSHRRRKARASSFSPAVPPACHKERAQAATSGHSRLLGGDR
jgi:hypothetical protein